MNKKELFEFIRDSLSITLNLSDVYDGKYLKISLDLINPETNESEVIYAEGVWL